MAITKNMSYDHPAYTAVIPVGLGVNAAGASAVLGGRFVAFTTTVVKSLTAAIVTAGTSTTHIIRSLVYRGGTGTETAAIATMGSSGFVNVVSTITLTQGDALSMLLSSDATQVVQGGAELVIVPGASVTP